ncbi:helix-turn-helix domain-containing protein [Enterococcus faecium]|uniref:helix-turn-helix domain-containing protein n=1 Tax=Enterococcus faecium TaxID=1352 RepID=UPI001D0F3F5F|nr:helix-turn-helix domain-containing protein [Enterococcus faecium]
MLKKKYSLYDKDLTTATEASLRWGYDAGYVRQMKIKYPGKIPEGEIRLFGKTWVITRAGMEALTGKKESKQQFYVIEEDKWSIQSQQEVSSFDEGKELLIVLILQNLAHLKLNEIVLQPLDSKKRKFGLNIKPGKSIYIETKN